MTQNVSAVAPPTDLLVLLGHVLFRELCKFNELLLHIDLVKAVGAVDKDLSHRVKDPFVRDLQTNNQLTHDLQFQC